MLCVAGVSAHVIIYRFSKQEVTTEVVQVGNLLLDQLASFVHKLAFLLTLDLFSLALGGADAE